jgi:SpoVK/Ycf46/Vps4 family AAA+-type ATPase
LNGTLKYWTPASDARSPWCPQFVRDQLKEWIAENEFADELRASGEKILPLLLAGESRCGKTSTLCSVANGFGIEAFRMNVARVIGSFLGETTKAILNALHETIDTTAAVWILDEVDGVFGKRGGASDGATREMNTAMTAALTMIENMPNHVTIAATTNELDLIDRAMVARFHVVVFPTWRDLGTEDRQAFAKSHGSEVAWRSGSYSECVQSARKERVSRIIEKARKA